MRRLAKALAGTDDDEPVDGRRSRAPGLLADPARALHLLDGGSLDDETGHRLSPPVNHHRIKTHGAITVRQPEPGLYVWRTPYGRYVATDHRGTRRIDPGSGESLFTDPDQSPVVP